MLLTLWAVLTTTGFATFVLGHLLGFHGVASIGAVLTMLTGLNVVADGLQLKDGEQITREYTTVGNETVENQTTVTNSYQNHSWTQTFASENAIGLGVFELLIGVLLFYQEMEAIADG